MATFTCSKCGKKNGKTAKFCKNCGCAELVPQGNTPVAPAEPDAAAGPETFPPTSEFDFDSLDKPGESELPAHETTPASVFPERESSDPPAPPNTSGPEVRFRVEVLEGRDQGQSVELAEGQSARIGASGPAELLLVNDDCVSGRHATLTLKGGRLFVEDHSRNGTFVVVRKSTELTDGDILRVGTSRLHISQKV